MRRALELVGTMNVKARDVEAGKGSAKTNVASADDVEERGDPSLAMSIVSGIWFLGSLALAVLGFWYLSESGYTPPPIPVGHVVANVITIPGAALSLSSLSSLAAVHGAAGCTPANRGHAARSSFGLLWGLGIVAFGYVRFWSAHPYTLPGCPCPVLSSKIDGVCVPCPGYAAGECDTEDCVCGTEGTCSERTAQCVCEPCACHHSGASGAAATLAACDVHRCTHMTMAITGAGGAQGAIRVLLNTGTRIIGTSSTTIAYTVLLYISNSKPGRPPRRAPSPAPTCDVRAPSCVIAR